MRVALVVPRSFDLWHFRRGLVRALLDAGCEVVAVSPPDGCEPHLVDMGCVWERWPVHRGSVSPLKEAATAAALSRILRARRPTIAHHFTIKPVIYGAAGAMTRQRPVRVATVTGLGHVWSRTGPLGGAARTAFRAAYRAALRTYDAAVFLNPDDVRTLGDPPRSSVIEAADGVDLATFRPDAVGDDARAVARDETGAPHGHTVVLQMSRMLHRKGVGTFAEAARELRRRGRAATFVLLGPTDPQSRDAVPEAVLRGWQDEGVVRWLPDRSDVRPLLAAADVVALPTTYREGVPRALIEAAAMGRPLVATDMPGCREIVRDGVNGLLVPPGDAGSLADAVERLVLDEALRARLASASRPLAAARFSEADVVAWTFGLYARLLRAAGVPVPRAMV